MPPIHPFSTRLQLTVSGPDLAYRWARIPFHAWEGLTVASGAGQLALDGRKAVDGRQVGNAHAHQPICSKRDTMIPSGPRT